MRTASPLRQFAASMLFPVALLAVPAQAAPSPATGTVSPQAPTLNYSSGPFVVSNPTDFLGGTGPVPSYGECGPAPLNPCDDFALTLDLPANYQSTNPNATVKIIVSWPDPTTTGLLEFDAFLLDQNGNNVSGAAGAASGVNPNIITIAAGQGQRHYTIRVEPFLPGAQSYSTSVALVPGGSGGGSSSGGGSGSSSGGSSGATVPGQPRYYSYIPPIGLGDDSGEPSIGYDPKTKHALYLASLQTLDVKFADNDPLAPLPAACEATWSDVSYLVTKLDTLDPIMFTDQNTGRTFVSQLHSEIPPAPVPPVYFVGLNSYFASTDSDGEGQNAAGQPNWVPGQIAPPSGGFDHQTVGAGPYPSPLPANINPLYPDAVYYCSQGPLVAVEVAFCSRSDDGGLTFGPGVPAYTSVNTPLSAACSNLHGHVKVAPDGTVYVPSNSCGNNQGVAISTDAGQTFTVSTVPTSKVHQSTDPSVGIATDDTAYFCYANSDGHPHVAVTRDRGQHWINDFDIGAALGIQNSLFPAAVAGDPDRAACAFIGTTTGGDYQAADFQGVWYPYIATTYDGGKHWVTQNAMPENPVQGAGGICTSGIRCSGTNRNLLDFNDMTMDEKGRPLFGFTHGCVGDCVQDPIHKNSFASKATIVRQSGGKTLFAANDPHEPTVPQQACLAGHRDDTGTYLSWRAPDNGGSALTAYKIYRVNPNGGQVQIGRTTKTLFNDRTADPTVASYGYKVTAINAQGEGATSNALSLLKGPRLEDTGVCATPGLAVVEHAAGKETDGQAQHSIESVSVAEPETLGGKIVFTLKMQDLSGPLTPMFRWGVRLHPPTVPASTQTNTVEDYFVSMVTSDGPTPTFTYGTTGVQQGEARTFTTLGNLDPASGYATDGTITLIIDKANIGSPKPGDVIGNILGSVRATGPSALPSTGGVNQTIPDSTGPGQYTLRSAKLCLPNPAPLANLQLTPASGTAPFKATLDGSASSDPNPDDTLTSYIFNFGDGSDEVTQSSPTITHIYTRPGLYSARLIVANGRGKMSSNVDKRMVTVNPPPPPAAPGGVTAKAGNGSVKLSWSAVSGASSYRIYQGTSAGGEAASPVRIGITGTSFTITGLTNGNQYFFKVSALTANSEGAKSAEVNGTPNIVLAAPTNLVATPGAKSVSLSWSAVPGASSYRVYQGTSAGGESVGAVATAVKTGTVIGSLTPGQKYYFVVKAVSSAATSTASNEANATPQ